MATWAQSLTKFTASTPTWLIIPISTSIGSDKMRNFLGFVTAARFTHSSQQDRFSMVDHSNANGSIPKSSGTGNVSRSSPVSGCDEECTNTMPLSETAIIAKKTPEKTKWIADPMDEDNRLLKRLEPSIRLLQMFGYYRLPFRTSRGSSYTKNISQVGYQRPQVLTYNIG